MDLNKMGKFIAQLRKEKKLTHSQLGEKLGVSGKAVSKWERGLGAPDISLLNTISEVLGVKISELLSGERIENDTTPEIENQITISSIGTYNRISTKRYTKIIIILSMLTLSLILALFGLYFLTNYNKFSVYSIVSESEDFYVDGLIVSNQKENNTIISGIEYEGPYVNSDQEIKVKVLTTTLMINDTELMTKISDYNVLTLNKALENTSLIVFENKEMYKSLLDVKNKGELKLILSYIDENGKEGNFIIPLRLDKHFSNNKLFY